MCALVLHVGVYTFTCGYARRVSCIQWTVAVSHESWVRQCLIVPWLPAFMKALVLLVMTVAVSHKS